RRRTRGSPRPAPSAALAAAPLTHPARSWTPFLLVVVIRHDHNAWKVIPGWTAIATHLTRHSGSQSAATDADAARADESRLYDAHVATSGDTATYTPAPGKPALLVGAFDIASVGYAAAEFFISGSASSYGPTAELTPDGRWSVSPAAAADYTTRIVVLAPSDLARVHGTVP